MLRLIKNKLNSISETIIASYGPGWLSYLKYLYYGLFRINRFVILGLSHADGYIKYEIDEGYKLSRNDWQKLAKISARSNISKEFYCDRAGKVSEFYLLTKEDKPAYIHWIYKQGDNSVFLRLKEQQAEINYVLTVPEHRGKNLCSKVVSQTVTDLFNGDVVSIFAVIHSDNIASIKAFNKVGFKEIGSTYRFLRLTVRHQFD